MIPVVLGLDLSTTSPGAVLLGGDGTRYVTTLRVPHAEKRSGHSGSQLVYIRDRLEQILAARVGRITVACIEDVFVGDNPKTGIILGRAQGIALELLCRYGRVPYQLLPVATPRRAVLGRLPRAPKGKAKEQVAERLRLMGEFFETDDAADAYVLARYGMNMLRLGHDPTKEW